jgi:uncharacterized BrkB/YihY/UPF0761 family membrane protein
VVRVQLRRSLHAGIQRHLRSAGGPAALEDGADTARCHCGNHGPAPGRGRHGRGNRALAQKVGNILGIGSTAVTVWEIAKWPVLLVIIGLILGILFWASPNAKHGFQWVSPGGFIAVVLWLIASALFALYVANFGHYNKVYGSLAGVIIFLIWMWISNVAILFGAEFNAELERGRAVAAGHPIEQEPFSELRDDRKLRKEEKKNRLRRE